MTSQQFNLRWNNHTNNLLQVFMDHFEKEQLVDVTLSCEGKFIKSHKIVLGACSPYFQEIFDRHDTVQHPIIILNGLKFDEIRSIVEFMYRGEVKVCESDLESLLATAENLQVKGLSNVRATRQGSNLSSSTNVSSSISSPQSNGRHSPEPTKNGPSTSNRNTSNSMTTEENAGTPLHLKRKRAKLSSPPKDFPMKNDSTENSFCGKPSGKNPSTSTTTDIGNNEEDEDVEDDNNSDDLPMTIKIDPPHIRDIDEEADWPPTDAQTKEPLVKSQLNSTSAKNRTQYKNNETYDGVMSKDGKVEHKEKIPRPPNAFMIFANEWRRKLASQHSNESNKEISVRLGIMWKNLSGDSKEDYFAASRQANEDHKKKYPDYYYSPKEARLRKRWKLQQQQVTHMMNSGQYNPVHLVKVFINEDGEENQKSPSALRA